MAFLSERWAFAVAEMRVTHAGELGTYSANAAQALVALRPQYQVRIPSVNS